MPVFSSRPILLGLWLGLLLPVFSQTPAARQIIIYGDSITAGGALPAKDRDRLWVNVLQKEGQGRVTLINEGKGGRPTASLEEFDAMLKRHPKADELVIALGMNDSRDLTDACVPKAVANVKDMIRRGRALYGKELRVLLVGPSNINKAALGPTKPVGNEREAKLRELGAAFETLAKETGADFVSLFGVVPESSLLKDGVHPDAEGNAAIATALRTWLAR